MGGQRWLFCHLLPAALWDGCWLPPCHRERDTRGWAVIHARCQAGGRQPRLSRFPRAQKAVPWGPPAGRGRPAQGTSLEQQPSPRALQSQAQAAPSPSLAPSSHPRSSLHLSPPPSPRCCFHAGPGHCTLIWTAAPTFSPGPYLPPQGLLPKRPFRTHLLRSPPYRFPRPWLEEPLLTFSVSHRMFPACGLGLSSWTSVVPG